MPKPITATWLRRRRIELKMSQQRAATSAGVGHTTWRNWERNGFPRERQHFEQMERVAAALQVSIDGVKQLADGREPDAKFVRPIVAQKINGDDRIKPIAERWPRLPEKVRQAIALLARL